MKDKISIGRIAPLHPKVRDTFARFIEAAETELNVTLRVTQGMRTIAEQDALYAIGRTVKGKIVTNAKGGQSYHCYGLAIDVVEMKNGTANWDFAYEKLKPIADRFGIVWGGNFRSIIDRPHFEISFGYSTAKLAKMAKDADGYVILHTPHP